MDLRTVFLYFAGFLGVVSLCAVVVIGSGINFTYISKKERREIANLECHGVNSFERWIASLKARTNVGHTATFDDLLYAKNPSGAKCSLCARNQDDSVLAQQVVISPNDWVIAALARRKKLGSNVSERDANIAQKRIRAFTEAVNKISYAYTVQNSRAAASHDHECEKMKLFVLPLIPPAPPFLSS